MMSARTVRGRLLPVGRPAFTIELPHNREWSTMRALVGGWVECVELTLPDADGFKLVAHVNEDGIRQGLALNRAFLYPRGAVRLFGPIVVLRERIDAEGETEYRDVTDQDDEVLCRMQVAVEAAVAS
jgi:hypothetical protein